MELPPQEVSQAEYEGSIPFTRSIILFYLSMHYRDARFLTTIKMHDQLEAS